MVEVEVDLVKREIHLDGVFHLQLALAARVSELDVAGFDRKIELAGASQDGGAESFIRRGGRKTTSISPALRHV